MKFLKTGRVAIITRGRYAGKKVVIIQPQDAGNKSHPYPHALVAGIERYPSQITRRMSKAKQTKRSKVKPFIKVINYNHLMPTRYTLELEGLKGVVSADTFKEVSQREEAKKTVKKALEERYTSGKNRWILNNSSACGYIDKYKAVYFDNATRSPAFETVVQDEVGGFYVNTPAIPMNLNGPFGNPEINIYCPGFTTRVFIIPKAF
ncbi:60S ribosomal protein L27B [Ciborinia camelliae]|nr:60S ribosomal protein L27B [Ciborinia camelliae]